MEQTLFRPRSSDGTTRLGPDLIVWNVVDAELDDHHGYNVQAVIRLHGRRFEIDELTVIRRQDGEQVTGIGIRALKLSDIVRRAVGRSLANFPPEKAVGKIAFINSESGAAVAYGAITTEDAAAAKRDGPVDSTLRLVGRVYTLAYAVQDRQAKAVADTFGVSMGTANAWIAKAKAAGYIITSEEGNDGTPEA